MNNKKRGRGRPLGSGIDDMPTLQKVADLMAANPALKATTAFRRIIANPGQSQIRRFQVKWKAGAATYLAEAHQRRATAPVLAPARRAGATYSPRTARQLMEAQRKMQEALGPGLQAAHAMMNTPGMMAAQEAARRLRESPVMRAMEELQNSPTMRAMRELQESPTMRAMREMQNSPVMRAVREASEEIARVQRLISGSGF
ncbi:hypothetical protein SD81_015975 [Tolypothrix campylonemoides VB511288]|nr:hypothetical protein SD81_015975 [Tolypothrix campylonemoides VB511288]